MDMHETVGGEVIKAELLATLLDLRYGYSEEVPRRIIHSSDADSARLKVRGTWFQMIVATVDNAIIEGQITESKIICDADVFHAWTRSEVFADYTRRTTADHIAYANQFLDTVIACLQPQNPSVDI